MAPGGSLGKVAFRVDAGASVGVGHLMRCLSIADALHDGGCDVVIVSANDASASMVASRGHRLRVLGTDYENMTAELPALEKVLNEERPSAVVIDSYFATSEYLRCLHGFARTVWIDDYMAEAMPVDAIVNYQIYADAGAYKSLYQSTGLMLPKLILGPSVMPLRSGFRGAAKHEAPSFARNVLVAVGGADPERMAKRLTDALALREDLTSSRVFHFMLGSFEPDAGYLREKTAAYPWLAVHENVEDVPTLMSAMDAAISAAGTTLYELCACGVPSVSYCLSDDQVLPARAFEEAGAVLFGGDFRSGDFRVDDMLAVLHELLDSQDRRQGLAHSAGKTVDGYGAYRLAELVLTMAGGAVGRERE